MSLIGKNVNLEVLRSTEIGLFLDTEDRNYNGILLPKRYVPSGIEVGDFMDVFIYRDSEDRIIATRLDPYIRVGEFAYLNVNKVESYGAFLDWGLPKDLFVPISQQRALMVNDGYYLVYAYLDKQTDRLAATAKVHRHLQNEAEDLEIGQEVNLLICDETDLGVRVIVDNKFWGLVFHNEIFQHLEEGQKTIGYVKGIRLDDNKIDITLKKQGMAEVTDARSQIIEALHDSNGFLPLNDKSAPELIYEELEMSKKVFKKAIGNLYKDKMITIKRDGIHLAEKED
ncbi:MAG: S1-like domain-containing RNA-binding protein [Flavobacteriales bacterium]|jgi:predicted RNA-binding protein (virulence factor B family)|tara:strand:- start:147 stop:998 length:852 start_codon:yes stop_codon:yes gene_type:complete